MTLPAPKGERVEQTDVSAGRDVIGSQHTHHHHHQGPPAPTGLGATLSTFVLGAVLWFTLGLGLLGLAQNLRRGRRRRRWMSWPLVTVASALGAAALIYSGAAPGFYVGIVVGAGMLTGALGDGLTRSGVPLAWPFTIDGRRWAMLGLPRRARFSTGTWPERVICWGCLISAPVTVLVLA
ncbi:hypothetical protein GCM10027570_35960 [Streptomonospora sediminis]